LLHALGAVAVNMSWIGCFTPGIDYPLG